MDVSSIVKEMASTCVSIFHYDDSYPSAGVLVQGKDYPVVLSTLHCFVRTGEASPRHHLYASLHAPEQAIEVEVVELDDRYDIIAFKVMTHIQGRKTAEVDIDPTSLAIGKGYCMFGFSTCKMIDPATQKWILTWRMTPGNFSTDLMPHMTVATTGGCVPGDSGGPLFSSTTGRLVGINVSVSLLHPNIKDEECLRMRNSAEGNAVPAWFLLHVIGRDFIMKGGGPAYYSQCPIKTTGMMNHGQKDPVFDLHPPPNVLFCGTSGEVMDIDSFIESMSIALDPYKL